MDEEPMMMENQGGLDLFLEPKIEEKKLPPKLTAAQIIEIANK